MLRNRDLNLLPVFDSLMQEQHLSKAAERLNMSQPAVSNALKRLRQGFDDELFVRTGRGLKPTQRARELHTQIAPALASIRESFEGREFSAENFSRTIDISMNHAVEHIWGEILLREARAQAPNLKWKLHPDYVDDIPARLKDGRLSYAVEYTPMPEDQFGSRLLLREGLTLICASDHPCANTGVTMEQFESLPQVSLVRRSGLIRTQNSRRTTPLEFLLGNALPERNIAVQMSSFVSVPHVVAATDLIAVVPSRLAKFLSDNGKLKCLPLPFDCPMIEVQLYWHRSRDNDPSHKWVVEMMSKTASSLGTADWF
ncbi:LysR substrate-binding domain-containing protein [Hoeflea poritis]|uniref:LysR substrate-binding domain-containing protein n=1 Tax=Hoeflea poritis TaxID=2993659 RepID=A0ABT4VKG4_9HYPH|nr:LysR substrate-binding domain-containing protein [Hoeflea poritis]MDA4845155.1 LysR substrate-binding domain-containing protein [Hoeflea poritis]